MDLPEGKKVNDVPREPLICLAAHLGHTLNAVLDDIHRSTYSARDVRNKSFLSQWNAREQTSQYVSSPIAVRETTFKSLNSSPLLDNIQRSCNIPSLHPHHLHALSILCPQALPGALRLLDCRNAIIRVVCPASQSSPRGYNGAFAIFRSQFQATQ